MINLDYDFGVVSINPIEDKLDLISIEFFPKNQSDESYQSVEWDNILKTSELFTQARPDINCPKDIIPILPTVIRDIRQALAKDAVWKDYVREFVTIETVADIPEDFILIDRDSDVKDILEYQGCNVAGIDNLFVKLDKSGADYEAVYGCVGSPTMDKDVIKIK